jgi:hypothetical protein
MELVYSDIDGIYMAHNSASQTHFIAGSAGAAAALGAAWPCHHPLARRESLRSPIPLAHAVGRGLRRLDPARHRSFGPARGAASEVAVARVLVMILAALIALFIAVTVVQAIAQRRPRGDRRRRRRRAHLPVGDEGADRRSG